METNKICGVRVTGHGLWKMSAGVKIWAGACLEKSSKDVCQDMLNEC